MEWHDCQQSDLCYTVLLSDLILNLNRFWGIQTAKETRLSEIIVFHNLKMTQMLFLNAKNGASEERNGKEYPWVAITFA